MVLDGPEFFLVTSVSDQVITLNVFSIRYVLLCCFSSLSMYFPFVTFVTLISTGTNNPVSFVSYCKWSKGCFIIDMPSLHLLHLLQGIRWPSIFSCNHNYFSLFYMLLL